MKKRLFLALPLPDSLVDHFFRYQRKLAGIEQLKNCGIRLTPNENLHITVLFLGFLEEEKIVLIFEAVKKVCRTTIPFSLEFSHPEMNRLVWAVFKDSAEFVKLKKQLEENLAGTIGENFRDKNRKTLIHATLARFKKEGKMIELPKIELIDGKFECGKILLLESQLRNTGPIYKRVAEFLLGRLHVKIN